MSVTGPGPGELGPLGGPAGGGVDLHHNGVDNGLHFFLFGGKLLLLSELVLLEPIEGLLDNGLDLLLVTRLELLLELLLLKLHSKRVKMRTTLETSEDENYTRNE